MFLLLSTLRYRRFSFFFFSFSKHSGFGDGDFVFETFERAGTCVSLPEHCTYQVQCSKIPHVKLAASQSIRSVSDSSMLYPRLIRRTVLYPKVTGMRKRANRQLHFHTSISISTILNESSIYILVCNQAKRQTSNKNPSKQKIR